MSMPQERLKVLLIEHDSGFTRRVGEMLGQTHEMPAEVRAAPNLGNGLSALTKERFDVVLLDLGLPDGAGLGTVPLIRAEAPQSPIIVAGEADDERVALEAVHAGAHDYLVKNQVNPGWLERSVRYAIERHRMDTALLAEEEKYHSVFDHLVEGIFRTTPDGHYLMANVALARIYGYSTPQELMEHVTDIARSLYVEQGRREEFVRVMQERDTLTGFESRIYRKDNSVIWISENCRAIRDAQGRLLYYEGTVEDITARRQAEESQLQAEENLRTSEALYHSLVETLPQNIFRKDLEGRFTFANQQFCRVLGRPLSEIIGKTDFDFFPRELAEKYRQDDLQVLQLGKAYETIEEHQPPGGSKLYVQVVKTPLRDGEGKIAGLQGIFWDITQQRLAEEKIKRVNALLAQSRTELKTRNLQMEQNLQMAADVQQAMLPQAYPTFPSSASPETSAFKFTHRYLPSGGVGGDFFTVSPLSDWEAAVFICDVAGHGVRSALVTAMVRALVEELKPLAANPGQFLTKLNSDLHAILKHSGSPLLTTAFYLMADYRSGLMRYANAGHPRPYHLQRQAGQTVALACGSGASEPALGMLSDSVYQTSEVTLTPGDMVMLYTDGLYEVNDANENLYSQEMLREAVQRRLALPAPKLLDELLDEIRQFTGSIGFGDDVCVVGMELAAPNA